MSKLLEDNRRELVGKSKGADNYVPWNQQKGKNRFARRLHSRVANSVKEFNDLNMNKLFKDNILDVNVKVVGETDEYIVRISFAGFLDDLHTQLKRQNNTLDVRCVLRALISSFNSGDSFVRCTCPDFKYRIAYWLSVNGNIAGDPETRPSDETNPHDTKGRGCKHILVVLNNTSWLIKVASVIYNYINYMEKNYPRLYAEVIYPAIYEQKYEEPVQMDMLNQIDNIPDDELITDKDVIDDSNKWAKTKTQFQKGNEYRFRPNDNIEGQKHFNFDDLVSDTEN